MKSIATSIAAVDELFRQAEDHQSLLFLPHWAAIGMSQGDNLLPTVFRVSQIARQRLGRMSRGSTAPLQETYLFASDLLSGVRYSAGPFSATWFFGDAEVRFFRGKNPVGTLPVDPDQSRQVA